jgi:hypothetical protein
MCGWDVFLDGESVCSLLFHSEGDMFWTRYCIFTGKEESPSLYSDHFWVTNRFVFRSRALKSYEVSEVICRYSERDNLIEARGLQIIDPLVSFTMRLTTAYRTVFGSH